MSFTRKKLRHGLAAAAVALATNIAPANAAVIYSGEVNINIGLGDPPSSSGRTFFEVDGLPFGSFIFDRLDFSGTGSVTSSYKLGATIIPGADVSPGAPSFGQPAAVVSAGDLVDASRFLPTYDSSGTVTLYSDISSDGAFELGDGGIVPFLADSGRVDSFSTFGWMRFASGSTLDTVKVVDFAYESTRGVGIIAGDTGISAVPLPATLPFALAGFGLLGWIGRVRRRPE